MFADNPLFFVQNFHSCLDVNANTYTWNKSTLINKVHFINIFYMQLRASCNEPTHPQKTPKQYI